MQHVTLCSICDNTSIQVLRHFDSSIDNVQDRSCSLQASSTMRFLPMALPGLPFMRQLVVDSILYGTNSIAISELPLSISTRARQWAPTPTPTPISTHTHGFWVGMGAIIKFMGGHGLDIVGRGWAWVRSFNGWAWARYQFVIQ